MSRAFTAQVITALLSVFLGNDNAADFSLTSPRFLIVFLLDWLSAKARQTTSLPWQLIQLWSFVTREEIDPCSFLVRSECKSYRSEFEPGTSVPLSGPDRSYVVRTPVTFFIMWTGEAEALSAMCKKRQKKKWFTVSY